LIAGDERTFWDVGTREVQQVPTLQGTHISTVRVEDFGIAPSAELHTDNTEQEA